MGAECEIELKNGDLCGVLASGRCLTCGRAFCTTHQAYGRDYFGQPIPSIGLCVQCANEQQEKQRKRSIEADAPLAFFRLDTARDILRKSGVQLANCYEVRRWIKEGFLTRKSQENATLYAHGWVLGTFTWIVSKYLGIFGAYEERKSTYESHTEECMTALLDMQYTKLPTHNIHDNFGLVRVRPYADGYEILGLGNDKDLFIGAVGASTNDAGWDRERWVQAGKVVRKLAGVPDDV